MNKGTQIKPIAFLAAMKEFFGYKPGQTLSGFKAELEALTDADREYFYAGLTADGFYLSPLTARVAPLQQAA